MRAIQVGEAASVFLGDRRIDLPNVSLGTPRRVVLIGDSGCRGEALDKPQYCGGDGLAKVWPFGVLSDEGADKRPDLIVHVGAYNYRGTERGLVLPPTPHRLRRSRSTSMSTTWAISTTRR